MIRRPPRSTLSSSSAASDVYKRQVLISLLLHYFLISAAIPLNTETHTYEERTLYFNNAEDGLFNLYVALTTANHPDVMMPAYERQWYMMLFLVSFMVITNLFLLNVFLAVVTTEYARMVRDFHYGKSSVCEGILGTAYHILASRRMVNGQLHMSTSSSMTVRDVKRLEAEKGLGVTKQDFFEVIHLLGQEFKTAHFQELRELWFNLMDVDADQTINFEEFEKLSAIVHVPFFRSEKQNLSEHELQQKQPRFPLIFKLVEFSVVFWYQGKEQPPDCRKMGKSTYIVMISVIIMFSILNALFFHPSPTSQQDMNDIECWSMNNVSQMIFCILFGLDVIIVSLADSTIGHPLRYFYHQENWFYNWTDIAVVAISIVIIAQTCEPGSTSNLYAVSGLLRVFRCIRIIMRIESFKHMYSATVRVLPAIVPQLLLFVTSFYVFAMFGMALFAGCVTEITADGGPGDWSTSPWSETAYGQDAYYYDLNFDDLYSSCITLFMLMIQNNWHVTVNGFVECTGTRWSRLYFIVFNICTALIMINIFVGIVLDMFDVYWKDELYKMGDSREDEFENLFDILMCRMSSKEDKDGKKLSDTWDIVHEIDSELLYSGVSPSDAVILLSEEANRTELKGLKTILNDMPMPVYCRTEGNKIAYANKVFAGLYGVAPFSLVGSYKNYLLKCNECDPNQTTSCQHSKERPIEPNRRALEMTTMQEYTEEAILRDGSKVVFRCSEKEIQLSLFKHTTVVYMFPMSDDGSVLLDTDGDGMLSKQDMPGPNPNAVSGSCPCAGNSDSVLQHNPIVTM
eukprot:TRINITY_DN28899_c0_g1_i3.p1 TRINITY_DN28899_c0_g1~~TRINITY_DN28899_c0_g1_i3.p1  ORF type:complete len:797 (-),score=211.14 TRINITY_DN28899_c0_g1_i3:369-2759(-)